MGVGVGEVASWEGRGWGCEVPVSGDGGAETFDFVLCAVGKGVKGDAGGGLVYHVVLGVGCGVTAGRRNVTAVHDGVVSSSFVAIDGVGIGRVGRHSAP